MVARTTHLQVGVSGGYTVLLAGKPPYTRSVIYGADIRYTVMASLAMSSGLESAREECMVFMQA